MNSGRALVFLLAIAVVAIAAIAFFTLTGDGPTGLDRPEGPDPDENGGDRPAGPDTVVTERTVVTGRVIRLGALSPVADAEVTLGDDDAKTDRDGRFSLEKAPVGPGTLRIKAEGTVPFATKLEIPKETSDLGEFRIGYPTVLKGQVVDTDARPIANANVLVLERTRYVVGQYWKGPSADQIQFGIDILDKGEEIPGEHYATDAEGRFRIEGLSPGMYFVSASAEGKATVGKEKVELPEGGEAEVNLSLPAGSTISGTVIDQAKKPVDGAVVIAMVQNDAVDLPFAVMERTVATAGGTFSFDRLINGGNYLIFARAPDGQIGTAIQIPAPTKDQKVKVGPRYTLYGTVVDDETGAAVEGAILYTILARGESDSGGRYELKGVVRSNPWPQIWVRAEGYEDTAANVKLSLSMLFAKRVEKNIRLTKVVPGTVRATVRDTNGNPLPGAKVSLREWGDETDIAMAVTDDSGVATITGVPAGGMMILASKPGYVLALVRGGRSGEPMAYPQQYSWISVPPGETGEIALSLISVGKVSGTVRDRAGKPIPGVVIRTNAGDLGKTNEKGEFSVSGIPERIRTGVMFRKPGFVDLGLPLEAGQREGLEVVMSRGATIGGVVTDEAGKPVGGIHVIAQMDVEMSPDERGKTDAEGKFRIEGLTPGDYTLLLDRDGFAARKTETIALGEAEVRDNLVIKMSEGLEVRFRLLNPSGDDVPGSVLIYGPLELPKAQRVLRRSYPREGREMKVNLLPGLYRILGLPAEEVTGSGATEYEHQITAGGEVEVELKTEVLRLIVRPNVPAGTRLGSVMLHRTEPSEPNVRYWFNEQEDGVFRSPPVPPGRYELGFWFRKPGADSWEYKEVRGIAPGTKVQDMDLSDD